MILAALLVATAALGLPAQDPPSDPPGDRLAVYLVSFGPGPLIWERFGHNALWIRDTLTGRGPAYDYGRFTFEQEHFFLNFARGRMRYHMGREEGVSLVDRYLRGNRAVTLQELNLAPDTRVALWQFLEAAIQDDGGSYRYDYYRDNCSTRVRDAIDTVAGGVIRATLDTIPTGRTYRFHTRRSLQNSTLDYFGVTASLGPLTDEPISAWQEAFLPLELRDHIRQVMVPGPGGRPVPIVRGEIQVSDPGVFTVPEQPADWTPRFLLAGVLLGGVMAWLGARARSGRGWRAAFLSVAGAWAVIASVAGGILLFFWGVSEHVVAYRNQNLWQLNLLSLALLLTLAPASRGEPGPGKAATVLAWAIAVTALLGLLLKGLPGFGQANGDILAFTLPAQLGLAAGVLLAVRTPGPSAGPPSPR